MSKVSPPLSPALGQPPYALITSGTATGLDLMRRYVAQGSGSSLQSEDEQRLSVLERRNPNADLHGGRPPTPVAVSAARKWLRPLTKTANQTMSPWRPPHMSVSEEGDVTFEWWCEDRKVTLYFGGAQPEFVRIWGPHIFDQMESGDLVSSDSFLTLWLWLNAA